MKLERILPSLHTAAEVSSQEDSIAKITIACPLVACEESAAVPGLLLLIG